MNNGFKHLLEELYSRDISNEDISIMLSRKCFDFFSLYLVKLINPLSQFKFIIGKLIAFQGCFSLETLFSAVFEEVIYVCAAPFV